MKTKKPEPGERHGRLVYVGGDEPPACDDAEGWEVVQ